MNGMKLWNLFELTGKVEDYLDYCQGKCHLPKDLKQNNQYEFSDELIDVVDPYQQECHRNVKVSNEIDKESNDKIS